MSELDKQIKNVNKEIRDLYREEAQRLITHDDFERDVRIANAKHRDLIRLKIDEQTKTYNTKAKEIKIKQEVIQEKVKKIRKEKNKDKDLGRKVIGDSYSSLIIKALKLKTINTEAKAIAIINTWKPGLHDENIRKQIRNTVSAIRLNKQPRYKHYTWDNKTYMVNQTCQQILF